MFDIMNARRIASHIIAQAQSLVLYHGTLRSNISSIQKSGLKPSSGWGGWGTEGVFLEATNDGALYWAKICHQRSVDKNMDTERFDREFGPKQDELLAVLKVTVPASHLVNLNADMEQAEDFGFDGDESDWQESLEEIGAVRYKGTIPPSWISV